MLCKITVNQSILVRFSVSNLASTKQINTVRMTVLEPVLEAFQRCCYVIEGTLVSCSNIYYPFFLNLYNQLLLICYWPKNLGVD